MSDTTMEERTTLENCITIAEEEAAITAHEHRSLRAELHELRRKASERDDWQALAEARSQLLVCYRLSKRASDKLLNTLDRLQEKLGRKAQEQQP